MPLHIAIFRALYLGDMLCVIPTVRAIRSAWPDAHITLVGLEWQSSLVSRFSNYFDDFLAFPGWPGLPEQEADPRKIISFLQEVQEREFDIVFQMQGNGEATNAMCMLWGARCVCGLRKPDEWAPDDSHFPISDDSEHEVLRFFKLLECFNVPSHGAHLEFPISAHEKEAARQKLAMKGLEPNAYICIHPGARDPRRRWSCEKFAAVANHVGERGYRIVLTGSEQERNLLNTLEKRIHHGVTNIVESFGHLPIGELASILEQSRLLISNDTGMSHVAVALNVPSVIIFSQWSDIRRWRPLPNDIHVAIPYEESSNTDAVLKQVTRLLTTKVLP